MNITGVLDASFRNGGLVFTDLIKNKLDVARAMVMQGNKILAAGHSNQGDVSANHDFALARYTSDGVLDTTFDGDGIVMTDLTASADSIAKLVLHENKILAVGTSNGSVDTGFETAGKILKDIGNYTDDEIFALTIQDDDKLNLGGFHNTNTTSGIDFCLLRYQ